MSTTLAECRKLLSKEIGDYWASTSTSGGSVGGTTIVDTALMAKANDWISDAPQEMYDLITEGTYDGEERKITSLDNSTGTLTVLAHGGQIASGIDYEIHRMFSASEKKRALIYAAKHSFPNLFKKINDSSKTTGNWLRNGDFEIWTSTSACTSWTASTTTITKTSTAKYFKRGLYSMKLNGSVGYVAQSWSDNDDLKELRGKFVKFSVHGRSDTTSCLRIGIYDGITTTYSDYHAGDSTWTDDDEPLEVQAIIDESASEVSFRIYHDSATGVSYVDDARVTGPRRDRVYIGDLGLAQNTPNTVEIQAYGCNSYEPWTMIHDWEVDSDSYLILPAQLPNYTIRIKGIGYLDFLSSGVSSELWTATIDIDAPQTYILVADAIIYLYTQMILPNYTSGERDTFLPMLQYWEKEKANRVMKYGMKLPPTNINWSVH